MNNYKISTELNNEFYGRAIALWYQASPQKRLEIMQKSDATKFKTAKAKLNRSLNYIITMMKENKTI